MTGMTQDRQIIPVILCGGSGARLWPMSREDIPKQFLHLGGNNSLLVDTVDRALKCSDARAQDVVIVTLDTLKKKTVQDIVGYDADAVSHILGEPCARNTAAAVAFAAAYVNATFGPDAIMWVLPADHYVGAPARLKDAVAEAAALAADGHVVTFGMAPNRPETGYGYIATGAAHEGSNRVFAMDSFTEKPDRDTAAHYIAAASHVWNSGMFIFTAGTIRNAFDRHAPEYAPLLSPSRVTKSIPADLYNTLPSHPFDKAVMEKIDNGVVVVCDIGWTDIGSWESLWELRDKDTHGNSVSGRVAVVESANCLIEASSLLVAAIGLEDVAIIEHGDTVLVADKKNPDAMRALVDALGKAGATETRRSPFETRPWGRFRILSENPGYKVKEITVAPGQKLSLQYHMKRCEFWTVVRGQARVSVGDDIAICGPEESRFIPVGMRHRLENTGSDDLVVVEVQCGLYLEEDDIIRCEDDYGRVAA